MKKYIVGSLFTLGVLASSVFALELTAKQQVRIETAAVRIVSVLERTGVTVKEFVDMLDPFKERFEGDEDKIAFVQAVQDATVDAYYGVENFDECVVYNDGCNTCMKEKNSYDLACTKRACFWEGIPSCESYDKVDDMTDQGICESEGGTWLDDYQECEGVSESFCDMHNGTYEECGSACRHDDPGGLCTLQCVQYCDMSDTDSEVNTHGDTQAELTEAMSLWSNQDIQHYTAEQKISCFCIIDYTRPISYMVVGGEVDMDSAMYADAEGGKLEEYAPELKTVEELFAMIQEAIDENAETITVSYDAEMGYPTSIWIDRSSMIADEETSYTYGITVE